MSKTQRANESDSEKSRNESGGSDNEEEEEYVVEKVVDKRTKNGKVWFNSLILVSFY